MLCANTEGLDRKHQVGVHSIMRTQRRRKRREISRARIQ